MRFRIVRRSLWGKQHPQIAVSNSSLLPQIIRDGYPHTSVIPHHSEKVARAAIFVATAATFDQWRETSRNMAAAAGGIPVVPCETRVAELPSLATSPFPHTSLSSTLSHSNSPSSPLEHPPLNRTFLLFPGSSRSEEAADAALRDMAESPETPRILVMLPAGLRVYFRQPEPVRAGRKPPPPGPPPHYLTGCAVLVMDEARG